MTQSNFQIWYMGIMYVDFLLNAPALVRWFAWLVTNLAKYTRWKYLIVAPPSGKCNFDLAISGSVIIQIASCKDGRWDGGCIGAEVVLLRWALGNVSPSIFVHLPKFRPNLHAAILRTQEVETIKTPQTQKSKGMRMSQNLSLRHLSNECIQNTVVWLSREQQPFSIYRGDAAASAPAHVSRLAWLTVHPNFYTLSVFIRFYCIYLWHLLYPRVFLMSFFNSAKCENESWTT